MNKSGIGIHRASFVLSKQGKLTDDYVVGKVHFI